MSVYTIVEREALETFLQQYPLGQLLEYQGISSGIENTNYFVTTTSGEFVLTLFEEMGEKELPYFLELMAYLAEHKVPSAHPLADNDGHYLQHFYDKPAALVRRLTGSEILQPKLAQCQALGHSLGHMHTATPGFPLYRANGRGPHWWRQIAKRLQEKLPETDNHLLQEEIRFQGKHQHDNLPRGVIHADLFRDNALFNDDELCGIIDFYYACDDVLLYDVAVTVNDWCIDLETGQLDVARLHIFLDAYQQQRPFTFQERENWSVMLRAAALRFWLSRLKDYHFPRPGELTHTKDPEHFKQILLARRQLPDDCQLPEA
ncbi:homoserine kinase [Candidatus Venteria ishoeyi]|uniref:Homoserine kinase n=1 Tax=Candidatus Venteria ishoeyi TaxID=1899563 RepID=A0A1H6FDH2_9GAMM|nr:homoserine kinase [Candidatus Venteria ishoeyi]MDM8547303.1 homoserine kinase [Candidatus Venteria ishoeyi]SEH07369.1 Homoserine kinase [Candidatus Venteria ishoeyi]